MISTVKVEENVSQHPGKVRKVKTATGITKMKMEDPDDKGARKEDNSKDVHCKSQDDSKRQEGKDVTSDDADEDDDDDDDDDSDDEEECEGKPLSFVRKGV